MKSLPLEGKCTSWRRIRVTSFSFPLRLSWPKMRVPFTGDSQSGFEGWTRVIPSVSALQQYLSASAHVKDGSLFIHPLTSTALSIKSLTKLVVTLIRTANPGSFFHMHDGRKYAATLAFLADTMFAGIAECTGWRSINVFSVIT